MGAVKRPDAWEKEYRAVWRREEKFLRRYEGPKQNALEQKVGEAVPEKLLETLHAAFAKAFGLVFEKGDELIAGAGRLEARRQTFQVNRYAAELREDRKTLRAFSREAARAGLGNVLLSGAAGIGMGLFGAALPDIPLFTAMLLKNVYETAASFGFDHTGPAERVYVLRLLETALSDGDDLRRKNRELDMFAQTGVWPEGTELQAWTEAAARRLSETLLYGKALQNIPVAGVIGGAGDAVIMDRVRRYAAVKYEKRFLLRRRLERK